MTAVADGRIDIGEADWSAAVAALRGAADVTLVCHVAPDGDALGSMLALARGLRASGAEVTATWGDRAWAPPPSYSWLPDIDTVVPPGAVPAAPTVLVVLDTASPDRLGVLADLPSRAGRTVVVDHHAHNQGIDGVQLVDHRVAATAVIVADLLDRLGVDLDPTTATLLYVGLVTDTGSFQHPVTTPAVHRLAARLVAAGVEPAAVSQQLWGQRPFGFQRVLGAALGRVQLDETAIAGRGLVWTWTTAEDLAATGVSLDEIEPVIDVVRSAREADVAVVLKQEPTGSFRVSTRSRGAVDVGAACTALGGGGHRLAAGFTSHVGVAETMTALRQALDVAAGP